MLARLRRLAMVGRRHCVVCGEAAIPPQARSDRETCGDACRQRRRRGAVLWTACEVCRRIAIPPGLERETCGECEERRTWIELACPAFACDWKVVGPPEDALRAAYVHRTRHTWGWIGRGS